MRVKIGGVLTIAGLLSFNGGFVDITTFIGLHGLFSAHITGNLATLCASLASNHQGILSKLLAFPEFFIAVMLTRLVGIGLKSAALPGRRILLFAEVGLLAAYLALGVAYGPFPHADSIPALLTAACAVTAMAVQDTVQIAQFREMAPTSYMTQTASQVGINLINLLVPAAVNKPLSRRRLGHFGLNLLLRRGRRDRGRRVLAARLLVRRLDPAGRTPRRPARLSKPASESYCQRP